MKITKIINDEEVVEDVTCDICGGSCLAYSTPLENPDTGEHLKDYKEFEYVSINNHWGYHSDKDWETWSAQVC